MGDGHPLDALAGAAKMSIIPDSPPPKPEHKNHDRPPLDLDNVLRQVNAIQEQLRREQEAKERK